MTPQRLQEFRDLAELTSQLFRDEEMVECLDYIDKLQRDVATYANRDELIVGRMMLERDLAREEANTLRAQLAAENQRASRLDATCGELQEELNRALRKNGEMSIELTAPRCPKCGSENIRAYFGTLTKSWRCRCWVCNYWQEEDSVHKTLDAAIDSWRPVTETKKKGTP